jgi:hypothetical protein
MESDLDYGSFYLPAVHPGTEMCKLFEEMNYSINPLISKYDLNTGYKNKYFKSEELLNFVHGIKRKAEKRIIKRFMKPKNLFYKVKSTEDLIYVLRLILFYIHSAIRGNIKIQGN